MASSRAAPVSSSVLIAIAAAAHSIASRRSAVVGLGRVCAQRRRRLSTTDSHQLQLQLQKQPDKDAGDADQTDGGNPPKHPTVADLLRAVSARKKALHPHNRLIPATTSSRKAPIPTLSSLSRNRQHDGETPDEESLTDQYRGPLNPRITLYAHESVSPDNAAALDAFAVLLNRLQDAPLQHRSFTHPLKAARVQETLDNCFSALNGRDGDVVRTTLQTISIDQWVKVIRGWQSMPEMNLDPGMEDESGLVVTFCIIIRESVAANGADPTDLKFRDLVKNLTLLFAECLKTKGRNADEPILSFLSVVLTLHPLAHIMLALSFYHHRSYSQVAQVLYLSPREISSKQQAAASMEIHDPIIADLSNKIEKAEFTSFVHPLSTLNRICEAILQSLRAASLPIPERVLLCYVRTTTDMTAFTTLRDRLESEYDWVMGSEDHAQMIATALRVLPFAVTKEVAETSSEDNSGRDAVDVPQEDLGSESEQRLQGVISRKLMLKVTISTLVRDALVKLEPPPAPTGKTMWTTVVSRLIGYGWQSDMMPFAIDTVRLIRTTFPSLDAKYDLTIPLLFSLFVKRFQMLDSAANFTGGDKRMVAEEDLSMRALGIDRLDSWMKSIPVRDIETWSLNEIQLIFSYFINVDGGWEQAMAVFPVARKVFLREMAAVSSKSEAEAVAAVISTNSHRKQRPDAKGVSRPEDAIRLHYSNIVNCMLALATMQTNFTDFQRLHAHAKRHNVRISVKTVTNAIKHFAYAHPTFCEELLSDLELASKNGAISTKADLKVYSALISRHVQAKRIDDALDALKRMKAAGNWESEWVCNALLAGFLRSYRLAEAKALFERMDGLRMPRRTAVSYATYMNGLFALGMWDDAKAMRRRMDSEGIRPNMEVYNTCIAAEGRYVGGDPRRGIELVRSLPVAPDLRTVMALARCHVALGDWDAVDELIRGVENRHCSLVGDVVWKMEIDHGRSTAQLKLAMEYFLNLVLKLASDRQDITRASRYHSLFRTWNMHPPHTATAALMRVFARNGDVAATYKLLEDAGFKDGRKAGDNMNGAVVTAHIMANDPLAAIRYMNSVIPGAGDGTATVEDARTDSGFCLIGRGTSYGLMLAHAYLLNSKGVADVHAQLRRFEAAGISTGYERVGGDGLGANEANVLLNCHMIMRDWESARDLWRRRWMVDVDEAVVVDMRGRARRSGFIGDVDATRSDDEYDSEEQFLISGANAFFDRDGKPAQVRRFGVDNITVSLYLDVLGHCHREAELHEIWEELQDLGFPLDSNNYISMCEALARCGFGSQAVDLVLSSAFEPGAKAFWSLTPLLRGDKVQIERLWSHLVTRWPQFETAVRDKMTKWIMEGNWVPEVGWRPT